MKAWICEKYGTPNVLKTQDVPQPKPKPDQVLVKVSATTVNAADVRIRALRVGGTFMRLLARLALGVKGPRNPILGSVLAGKVVEIGSKVQDISVGDEVYAMQGIKMGGYAEYSTIKDRGAIALKPCNASFAEATAILFGGTTAIHFLNKANISNAKTILIYGATGDVGIAALQIAQLYGLDVTAVCSERGKDLSQALGAKTIIDYEKEDFTATGKVFDIVFDAVGYTSEKACKHLVSPNGKFITVGGMDVAKERKEDLQQLADWYDQGEIKAVIDRTYAFDDLIKAHEYVDTERKKGSVIINVAE